MKCARGGRLVLHRWGQWISRHHPGGVYDGEWGKVADYTASVPPYAATLVREAIAAGRPTMILAEEWQTAEALCRTADLVRYEGLADSCTFVWNCNHPICLDNVNWHRLAAGGVAVVGRTGEDYASDENAVRLRTGSAQELAGSIQSLAEHPATGVQLRTAGRHTARRFVWEHILSSTLWRSASRGQMTPQLPAVPVGAGRP